MALCKDCQKDKSCGIKIKSCTLNEVGLHQSFNDKPAIVYSSGRKEWQHDGEYHRTNGPAIKDPSEQTKEWWISGELHREDGPAYIFKKDFCYFLDGYEIEFENWEKEVKRRKKKRELSIKQNEAMKKWILAIMIGGIILGIVLK